MSQQNKRRWFLIGGAVLTLLIIVLTAWLLRDSIQENIIEPTASRVWWWWNFSRMLFPQAELWILLILLGIVKLTWFAARRTSLQFSNSVVPQKTGRVGHWLELLHLGHRAQRLFIKPFRFLAVDVIAEKEQVDRELIFSNLHRQTAPLPAHLQSYLNTGHSTLAKAAAANNNTDLSNPKAAIDPEIEEIIKELEIILESPHDT